MIVRVLKMNVERERERQCKMMVLVGLDCVCFTLKGVGTKNRYVGKDWG